MNIDKLHYFLAVAELGNITRAAEKLHITQPALSKVIRRIEEEVGANVFDRSGNRVTLNEYGLALRDYAEKAIMEQEMLRRRIGDLKYRARESVFIGYTFPPSEPIWLFEGMRNFALEHPDVIIRMTQLDSALVGEYLRKRRIDFAVSMQPFPASDIVWREVQSDPLGILLSSDHPLARKDKVWLSDLKGVPIYCPDPTTEMSVLLHRLCKRVGFTPDVVYECPHSNFINECVWNERGVAFMTGPFYTVERANLDFVYEKPKMIFRKLWDPFCVRSAGIATLRDEQMPENVQQFYDELVNCALNHTQYTSFVEDGPLPDA